MPPFYYACRTPAIGTVVRPEVRTLRIVRHPTWASDVPQTLYLHMLTSMRLQRSNKNCNQYAYGT